MPLTVLPCGADLDQLTTHARLTVGWLAVTVPEDLAVIPAGARHPGGRPLQLTVAADRTTIMTTVT